MKIEKLPSGSYRMRKRYNGKVYTVITDYKPTQKEALELMAKKMNKGNSKSKHMTFLEASEAYRSMKSNVLSPSTLRSYKTMQGNFSEHFKSMLISDIEQEDIQKEINLLAKEKSPKTVRNHHGYLTAVLTTFRQDIVIRTTLPQKRRYEPYIPSEEEVNKVVSASVGTEYEIAIKLACMGMRLSEICALKPSDIENDIVHITRALVPDENSKYVLKDTKTTNSTRDIVIPMELADLIREKGYVYKRHPTSLDIYLYKTEDALGIERFSVHKLRHYFCSKMSTILPEEDILEMGGWSTSFVMKSVYRHKLKDEQNERQRNATAEYTKSLFSDNPMTNSMTHS